MPIDPKLYDFATDRQAEFLRAVEQHGSERAANNALGLANDVVGRSVRAVRAKAALAGYAPGHWSSGTAAGYQMGKVTVQRDRDGIVERVWERQHPGQVEAADALQRTIAAMLEPIRGLAPLTPLPPATSDMLLSVYPIGDQHHGMYAEAAQTGADYNTDISAGLLETHVDFLCRSAPPSGTAILLDVGDFHHANDSNNETPQSKHAMHVTASYGKVMQTGAMMLVNATRRLLEKHATVIVWIMPGNHNPDAAFATALAISFYFHNEPRVQVDLGNSAFKYLRFGKNLIAAHHGDGPKLANLPLIMAVDRPDDWAATEYRVWHCGHIHHKTFKEEPGVDVETHRTLAPSNAWDHKKGYRSKREMQRIDYHFETGEWNRQRCDAKSIMERAA